MELDCEQQGKPESTFYSGPNIRAGTFPCAFDASRKKMLWFFFVATVMSDQEMVQCLRSSCRQGCTTQLIGSCLCPPPVCIETVLHCRNYLICPVVFVNHDLIKIEI